LHSTFYWAVSLNASNTADSTGSTGTSGSGYATSTIAPPGPTPTGTTANCGKWYEVVSGDTCNAISESQGIELALFEDINLSINTGCTNLVPGLWYCVEPTQNWNGTNTDPTGGSGGDGGSYALVDHYDASNFATGFEFFTNPDPSDGSVTYLDQEDATSDGLFKTIGSQVYLGVDSTTAISGSNRGSIRVQSVNTWTEGLFVWDLAHVPNSMCGIAPALWTLGSNFPNNGEIDGE
jgi:hypothetical protein